MTTEGHNKTLGTMHLVYGAMNGLVMLMLGFMFAVMIPVDRSGLPISTGMPLPIYIALMVMITIFGLLFTIPSLAAGYALLKQKSWARIASLIAAVIEGMNFPFGMALCVYTFWFLYGKGAHLYDNRSLASRDRFHLPHGEPSTFEFTAGSSRERRAEHEYVPPPQMPNWRD
ncbi:MAG TPA: hypothetical protein VM911_22370 [Pyrinomonadaceae bacterium]|jgi:hypothetical protein|nr:hypothetical protein [Pyrinomonadaceae bacterium]